MTNVHAFPQDDVLEQAAMWVDRLDDPALTETERDRFEAWMGQSSAHRLAFAEMRGLWVSDALETACRDVHAPFGEVDPVQAPAERRPARRTKALLALAACLVGAVALSSVLMSRRAPQLYETAPGERREVVLADGSRLTLSGDSVVSVRLVGDAREARLTSGVAYLEVASDERPFRVRTESATITVLGTRFNVDRADADQTTVSVFEGRVRVTPADTGGDGVVLETGQAVAVTGGGVVAVRAPPGSRPAWIDGWFDAENVPLSRLVRELNRQSPTPIRLSTQARDVRVTGRFKISEPQRVFSALSIAYGVKVETSDDGQIVLTTE